MQDGALLNCIKSINNPDINNILPRQEYSSTDYQYCFSAAKSKGGVVFGTKRQRFSRWQFQK